MPFDQERERNLLRTKVEALRKLDYLPADLLEFVNEIYGVQITARAEARVLLPGEDKLARPELRVQGAPLLSRFDLPFDAEQARALFAGFCKQLQSQSSGLRAAGESIAAHCASHGDECDLAFLAYRNQDEDYFTRWAERTADAPRAMAFLAQSAMTPSLAAASDQLAEVLPAEDIWEHGYCPVCGSLPLIGCLEHTEGGRKLCCSYCLMRYRVVRIGCPFCGEKNFNKISYLHTPEDPSFKVHVCSTCSCYIKTADFRESDFVSLPLFDDLQSLPLDILAQKKGYRRPTPSGWGF